MKNITIICVLLILSSVFSCTKKLDVKPDNALFVAETIGDLQSLLDNDGINTQMPLLGETGGDNYYLLDTRYNSLSQLNKNTYTWKQNPFSVGDAIFDWTVPFTRILTSNVVLDGIGNLKVKAAESESALVRGNALFLRAFAMYSMAPIFCKAYGPSAHSDLGLPLRNTSNINVIFQRSSLKETFDFIVKDLNEALPLLPELEPVKTRASKTAVYALLSRIYLYMGSYELAIENATKAMSNTVLVDYNDVPTLSSTLPFAMFNPEVIYHATLVTSNLMSATNTAIDNTLFAQYHANDLRKTGFFRTQTSGLNTFKGNYSGNASLLFGGLASDELFFIRSEAYARTNRVANAIADLNEIMVKRWKRNTGFSPFSAASAEEALSLILTERRKELLFRGLRLSDIKRLNKEPNTAVTLKRAVSGTEYIVLPNDPRLVYPIPLDEVLLSGLQQN